MGLREFLQRPLIIRMGQFAVTGEWNQDGYRRLAELIADGPHDSILDLGSGRSPLLQHLQPERYAGIDLHQPDLDYASEHHGMPGYEFIEGDILTEPLERWRGVDVVTASSVFHHLSDDQVVELIDRISAQVAPKRMVFSDGVVVGPLGGLIARLDYGDPTRPKEELYELFRPRFEVAREWGYITPFRSGHVFGFELQPEPARASTTT